MDKFHTPVLTKESIDYLKIKKDCWYIDCTLGGGGHAIEIIKNGGKVLGIDQDPDAIDEVSKKFSEEIEQGKLILKKDNFINLKHLNDPVCGVLFDLGLSSHQLEKRERGFSFNSDAPLDMRMDPDLAVSAKDLVNVLHSGELSELFSKFGEEDMAQKIAREIVEERKKKKIETTKQLADLILKINPRRSRDRIHPATKVFQALRIAVNDELNNLKSALPEALEVLEKGGRVVVISFHSLEDRIVKDFFIEQESLGKVKILTDKPILPGEDEVFVNPRSRSAKMRVAEKI